MFTEDRSMIWDMIHRAERERDSMIREGVSPDRTCYIMSADVASYLYTYMRHDALTLLSRFDAKCGSTLLLHGTPAYILLDRYDEYKNCVVDHCGVLFCAKLGFPGSTYPVLCNGRIFRFYGMSYKSTEDTVYRITPDGEWDWSGIPSYEDDFVFPHKEDTKELDAFLESLRKL